LLGNSEIKKVLETTRRVERKKEEGVK